MNSYQWTGERGVEICQSREYAPSHAELKFFVLHSSVEPVGIRVGAEVPGATPVSRTLIISILFLLWLYYFTYCWLL